MNAFIMAWILKLLITKYPSMVLKKPLNLNPKNCYNLINYCSKYNYLNLI